jgi:DNA-binding IclR family transcriptional regulator
MRILGSRRRTEVMILVALLGDTYPTEIARLLQAPLYSAQKIVDSLEREGVVATRLRGGTRWVSLDPRFFAARELRALLLRLAEAEPELRKAAEGRRSRPQRGGKAA